MRHVGRPNHFSCQGIKLGLAPSGPIPLFSQGRKADARVSTSPRPCQLLPGRQAWGNRELLSVSSTTGVSTNTSFPEGHVRTCKLLPGPGSKARCSANAVSWECETGQHSWHGQRSSLWSLEPARHHCHVREQRV